VVAQFRTVFSQSLHLHGPKIQLLTLTLNMGYEKLSINEVKILRVYWGKLLLVAAKTIYIITIKLLLTFVPVKKSVSIYK
jgi:hypothetical protein